MLASGWLELGVLAVITSIFTCRRDSSIMGRATSALQALSVPKLAHISDIHFGETFDVDVWTRVRSEIKTFRPALIVASGDFSDHPDPLLLLAAKCELVDLCAECGPDTQFFVVPGNHDVLDSGNIWRPGGTWWFERVMFRNLNDLRNGLESSLGFKLGLNADTWHWAKFPRWKRLRPKNWIWLNVQRGKCDSRLQSCEYHRAGKRWPTQNLHNETLIACFNSNSSLGRFFAFATGDVGAGQITRLGTHSSVSCPNCGAATANVDSVMLRVAVLHHHALPIAVPTLSLEGQAGEATLEPFLVLRNAGDLVHELQRQKFDIILHGHKHRPQFARVELHASDPNSYPLLVLAAGSTAKSDELAPYNTLRLITTAQNGCLSVETYEQGNPAETRRYLEPVPIFKTRALVRAMDRTGMMAEEYRNDIAIDGVGHLRSVKTTINLRIVGDNVTLEGIPIRAAIPSHDRLVDPQIEEPYREVGKLSWRQHHALKSEENPEGRYYWLAFNDPLSARSEPLTFAVAEAAANSIAMTCWEIDERRRKAEEDHKKAATDRTTEIAESPPYDESLESRPEPYEEAGTYVSYPIEKLVLNLYLPSELDGITPEVLCQRHPDYPLYPLAYKPGVIVGFRQGAFPLDDALMEEESKHLRYDATERCWTLEIDRPIAGYVYSLRWKVPNPLSEWATTQETRSYQKMLLGVAGGATTSAAYAECNEIFIEMARELMKRFSSTVNPHEQLSAFLMVYDEDSVCLRPVFKCLSTGSLPEGSYEVPLGGGVAGAAFLQRRILTWNNDPKSQSLIKAVPASPLGPKHVLALPIYHQQKNLSGELRLDTRPGATIGVVTLGSDGIASAITECAGEDETAREISQEAQEWAQRKIVNILSVLSRGKRGGTTSPS